MKGIDLKLKKKIYRMKYKCNVQETYLRLVPFLECLSTDDKSENGKSTNLEKKMCVDVDIDQRKCIA